MSTKRVLLIIIVCSLCSIQIVNKFLLPSYNVNVKLNTTSKPDTTNLMEYAEIESYKESVIQNSENVINNNGNIKENQGPVKIATDTVIINLQTVKEKKSSVLQDKMPNKPVMQNSIALNKMKNKPVKTNKLIVQQNNKIETDVGSVKTNISSKQAIYTFLDLERTICLPNKSRKWKQSRILHCPRGNVVTVVEGGRLGNLMWEYASVWAVSKRTGLEAYVPRCISNTLKEIFDELSVPSLEDIAHCPLDYSQFVNFSLWKYTNQSILLSKYATMEKEVLIWDEDIKKEFTFNRKIIEKSQSILHATNSSGSIFVGVHVRRTDYIKYIWRKYKAKPAEKGFYLEAMRNFEIQYENVTFIVLSDEPEWCKKNFLSKPKHNIHITKTNSNILDLAILASCNHTIFDYGTYGQWGATLAGGKTIYYNLTQSYFSHSIARILPNWHSL